jgi:hypothetical protein
MNQIISLELWQFLFWLIIDSFVAFFVGYFVCEMDWKKSLKKLNKNKR